MRTRLEKYQEVARLAKALAIAESDSIKRCEKRADVQDESRARLTTANARWERAAEERDRLLNAFTKALQEANLIG